MFKKPKPLTLPRRSLKSSLRSRKRSDEKEEVKSIVSYGSDTPQTRERGYTRYVNE